MKDLLIYFVAKKDEFHIDEFYLNEVNDFFDNDARRSFSVLISKEYDDIKNNGVLFVVLSKQVVAIATYKIGVANVTNKKRVSVRNILTLPKPIEMDEILKGVPKAAARNIPQPKDFHEVVLPVTIKTKIAIINYVKSIDQVIGEEIDRLYKLISIEDFVPNFEGADIYQEQKDSLLFLLGMVTRRGYSVANNISHTENGLKDPFELLLGSNAIEDDYIFHDASNFGDISTLKESCSNGTYRYVDNDTNLQLIVSNCNRKKLETTLGVDLIIYNKLFNSYILIQYKKMSKNDVKVDKKFDFDLFDNDIDEAKIASENLTYGYRPDSDQNFKKELLKMNNVFQSVGGNSISQIIHDWRIGNDFLFFKICGTLNQKLISGNLVSGMYLPLTYVNALLKSTITDGPRKGKIFTYNNCPSYLNKDVFLELAKKGAIGSRKLSTEVISNYIHMTLNEDKAIVLAVIESAAIEGREKYE